MLCPQYFVETLQENNIDFFTGVPDSLLKSVCAYITDHTEPECNIIAANEGAALSLAAGYHLATHKIPVVYMQNSGLGNCVNPLMSLVDKAVYHIPVLLVIGWRGEPGIKDEPQHIKQGQVTLSLLETMGIRYEILAGENEAFKRQLQSALAYQERTGESFAFVVRKGTFEEYKLRKDETSRLHINRETAIRQVVSVLNDNDVVVSTTGMISRELFEIRAAVNQGHHRDFLTVGSMGHASQIALGIALQNKNREVYCLDGDGALLMHMGSLAITGNLKAGNYKHIVFNNGAHDSVGGQPTVCMNMDLPQIALGCGYRAASSVVQPEMLPEALEWIKNTEGPVLLEIKVRKGARKDLGRPTRSPEENKGDFMKFIE